MSDQRTLVLAAGFASEEAAAAAARDIRTELDVDETDLRLEALGGEPLQDGYVAVLSGRFPPTGTAEPRAVFERHGGVVLAVQSEDWLVTGEGTSLLE